MTAYWKLATAGVLAVALQAPALGQATPTYSLEATEVNGTPIPQAAAQLKAAPGDTLTVEIRLRDWSPAGQKLRSFQASLDPASFATGEAGSIKPVAFGEVMDNSANAFIDEKHAEFVQKGRDVLQVVDTNAETYRFMAVLFNEGESPLNPQDGKKYYCGTIRMKVSDDARGTFRVALHPPHELSMIVDPGNNKIEPLAAEALTVDVVSTGEWLRIQASDPPSGAVDARAPASSGACRWDSVRLTSSGDAATVKKTDFKVEDGSDQPPQIRELTANGSTVEVVLSRPMSPGRWTRITHVASGTAARLGCLPGDVNNDQVRDGRDIVALVETLNGPAGRPTYQADINGDGGFSGADLAKLIDLLETARREGQTRLSDK